MSPGFSAGRSLRGMTRGFAAAAVAAAAGGVAGLGYCLTVTGRPTVFDVIAAPYLERTPRAMAGKLRVLERGTDMVLAEHYTPVHGGRLIATTVETVTFDRPRRVAFRLVRGPVPQVTEEFTLSERDGATTLGYAGELGADFGAAGQWWAAQVAAPWEAAVRASFAGIKAEAERRAGPGGG